MLPPGFSQPPAPSSCLQSPPPDWETSRSSAHSHMFLPRAQGLCSPSQQDFLLISRKLQAGARGQESLGENTTVSPNTSPLPTPSAGPEAAKSNRTDSHRTITGRLCSLARKVRALLHIGGHIAHWWPNEWQLISNRVLCQAGFPKVLFRCQLSCPLHSSLGPEIRVSWPYRAISCRMKPSSFKPLF